MLDTMRGLAKTPVAKFLLLVLVVSFGIWGVKGLASNVGDNTIAHVGKQRITVEDFQRVFSRQVDQMKQQFGDSFNSAQARMFGIDTQVLTSLIAGAALDENSRKLHLAAPDDIIAKQTRQTKAFFGPDGQFSQAQFTEVLRRSGYNENAYFDAMRRDITRSQLLESIAGGLVIPDAFATPLYRFQTEKRVVRYVVIAPDSVTNLPEPTDDEIKTYFDTHKEEFRTSEYRKITYAILDPVALAKTLTIDEAKAREYFDFHKDEFGKPETRDIEQILFPSQDAAKAAKDAIAGGKSFVDAAKDAGFAEADIKLGTRKVKDLAKPIADAAFALEKDAVSAPVETEFGWALLKVTAIAPGVDANFTDARPAVDAQLAKDEANEKIYELGNTLEDKRQSGAKLEDAAKAVGIEARVIEITDTTGHRPDGTPVAELDGQKELLDGAFKAAQGEEGELIPTAAGGYVALRVDAITPPADKTFDTVKSQIHDTLLAQARSKALDEKANLLLQRAKGGATLDALASELGRVVQTSEAIQRSTSNETFSREAVAAAFATAKDGFAMGTVGLGESRLIMQVSDIQNASDATMTADMPQVRQEVERLLGNEIIASYAGAAQKSVKFKINEKIWNGLKGEDSEAPAQ